MTSLIKETGRGAGQVTCVRRRAAFQLAEELGLRQRLVSLQRLEAAMAEEPAVARDPAPALTR
jgi:hypothetical protein